MQSEKPSSDSMATAHVGLHPQNHGTSIGPNLERESHPTAAVVSCIDLNIALSLSSISDNFQYLFKTFRNA